MLTDRTIRAIKPPERGQREVADGGDVKGLTILVSARSRVFFLVFRSPVDGRQSRIRLGEYPAIGLAEARQRGRDYREMIERGVDPRQHERAEAERVKAEAIAKAAAAFGATADAFIAHCHKAGMRSAAERERMLRVYIPEPWRDRPPSEISRGDVRELLTRLEAAHGAVQTNRVIQCLRAVFNWAEAAGRHAGGNPAARMRSARRELSRDRVLSDGELAAVWRAAPQLGAVFGPMLRVLILTAQRAGEVSAMRWVDVDLERGMWTIPRESYKTGKAHAVPLAPAALAILEALPRAGAFVFSATGGRSPVFGRSKAKARMDRLLPDLPSWTWHDLRRTAATGMARLGVLPHVTEAVLGHDAGALTAIARVYQRADYGDEKRRALEAWATHVAAITDESGRVVTLAGRPGYVPRAS